MLNERQTNVLTSTTVKALNINSLPASLPRLLLKLMAGDLQVEDQGRQVVYFSR